MPWALPGSSFAVLALSLCQSLPVALAADQLRVASKRLWRRIEHDVGIARQHDEIEHRSLKKRLGNGSVHTTPRRFYEFIALKLSDLAVIREAH